MIMTKDDELEKKKQREGKSETADMCLIRYTLYGNNRYRDKPYQVTANLVIS